jgi:hypothetical protein
LKCVIRENRNALPPAVMPTSGKKEPKIGSLVRIHFRAVIIVCKKKNKSALSRAVMPDTLFHTDTIFEPVS